MAVATDLHQDRLVHDLDEIKRYEDTRKINLVADNTQRLEKLKDAITNFEKRCELAKLTTKREHAQRLQDKEFQVQSTNKELEVEMKEKKASTATAIE